MKPLHTYILGTLTNLNSKLLHDRSSMGLICYNFIIFIRNSNKLESRIGNSDARSDKWNKKYEEKLAWVVFLKCPNR